MGGTRVFIGLRLNAAKESVSDDSVRLCTKMRGVNTTQMHNCTRTRRHGCKDKMKCWWGPIARMQRRGVLQLKSG